MSKTSIKEFLETVPSTCSHNFRDKTLEESARKIRQIGRELSDAKESFDKECLEFLKKQNIVMLNYTFNKAVIGLDESVHFEFKFKIAYKYTDNLKDALMQEINQPQPRQIHFSNLNDLNSAKFLTDDEKRNILGLSPQKEEAKS